MSLAAMIAFILGLSTSNPALAELKPELRPAHTLFINEPICPFIGLYIGGLDLIIAQQNNPDYPVKQILCHEAAHRKYSQLTPEQQTWLGYQFGTYTSEEYAQYFTEHWQDCYD